MKTLEDFLPEEDLSRYKLLTNKDAKRIFIQEAAKRYFPLMVHILGYRDTGAFHVEQMQEIAEVKGMGDYSSRRLWLWARGHFKAVDENEPVPTPLGFVRHGDIKVGDEVFSPNGKAIKVIGRSETFINSECYKITFSDGYSVVVSGDHLWCVGRKSRRRVSGTNKRQYRDWSIKTTEELHRHDHKQDNRYSVPLSSPVKGYYKFLPVHPYVLGAWLGDGSSASGGFTCDDQEIIDNISKCGYIVSRYPSDYAYGIKKLKVKLRGLGVLSNKHIPMRYMIAPENDRMELLNGLMDTDGTCDSRGTANFCNKSKRLATDFFRLANSLGLCASIRRHKSKYKGEDYYFFQVSFQAYGNIFKLKRKQDRTRVNKKRVFRSKYIISVEKTDTIPTNCIKVESKDGLYLIGDRYTATHNTSLITEAHSVWLVVNNPNIRILLVSNTIGIAEKILRNIKSHFMVNAEFRYFFAEFCPQPNTAGKIEFGTTEYFTTPARFKSLKEPTMMVAGIGTNLTGLHFDYEKIDDLVTKDSTANDTQIQTSKDYYSTLRQLFDNPSYPKEDVIGTIYHFNDLYCDFRKSRRMAESFIPVRTEEGISFPERFSDESLNRIMIDVGPYEYSTQYMLNPVNPADAKFKQEWIKYYDTLPEGLAEYITCDPASTQKKKSDFTVIMRWGVDSEGNHYLLEGVRDKLTAFQRVDKLFMLVKNARNLKWVKYEVLGGRHGDLEVIRERQIKEQVFFNIQETKGTATSKADRIEQRLVPAYHAGVINWPRQMITKSVYDGNTHDFIQDFLLEFLQFPFSEHDDILDCQSQIFEDPKMIIKGSKTSVKKSGKLVTADDWERFYSNLEKEKNMFKHLTNEQFRDRRLVRKFKSIVKKGL